MASVQTPIAKAAGKPVGVLAEDAGPDGTVAIDGLLLKAPPQLR